MSRAVTTLAIVLLLTSACANPAADKPKAVTGEAAPVASAPATGERYSISPQSSKIEFVGSKVTGSHNGSFERFSGDIDYQGQPENLLNI
jgi:polyisoprenoid-binding protein YceI